MNLIDYSQDGLTLEGMVAIDKAHSFAIIADSLAKIVTVLESAKKEAASEETASDETENNER